MKRRSLLVAVLSCCALAEVVAHAQPPEEPLEVDPRLNLIRVPELFTADPFEQRVMLLELEGEKVDPKDVTPIVLWLLDGDGEEVDAVFTHTPVVSDLLFGRGEVGLDVIASALTDGLYQLCAAVLSIERALPTCVVFQVAIPPPTPCELAWLAATLENPDYGCSCLLGRIDSSPAGQPHGSLGGFTSLVGGDWYGEYHATRPRDLVSVFKFKAHFEVEILNDPGRAPECTPEEWRALSLTLCEQGQRVNFTTHDRAGTPYAAQLPGKHRTEKNSAGLPRSIPYEPKPKLDAEMDWDGHGYRFPVVSTGARTWGPLKTHEDGYLIHWLDAPGAARMSRGVAARSAAFWEDGFFHSFVHGTAGVGKNCDCTFGLRYGVVKPDGTAGPSKFLQAPDCSGCKSKVVEGPRRFRACYTTALSNSAIERLETERIAGQFRNACVIPCRPALEVTAKIDRDAGYCKDLTGIYGVWADVEYTASCQ